MIEASEPGTKSALSQLLKSLQIPEDAAGGSIRIEGGDFPSISPHRLGSGTAVAVAAYAAAVAAVWRARGGAGQSVWVETARAAQALRTGAYLRQNGMLLPRGLNSTLGYYRTADERWVYVYTLLHFLDTVLELLNVPSTPAAVAAAVVRWRAEDIQEAMNERKAPCTIARTHAEWRAHPQGQWLADCPVVDVERLASSPPEPLPPAARPLSSVRVLDMAHVLCGPMIGRFLAEQGADVLHVAAPHLRDSDSIVFTTSWGKRAALADFRQPEIAERLRHLAKSADIIIQSWRPGALDRYGLGAAEIAAQRPGIIYVSVSCYGAGGPWGDRGGYDPLAQAAVGMAVTEGRGAKPQPPSTVTVNDYLSAYHGAAGALSALLRRSREGGGYHVKVALARSCMWLQELGLLDEAAKHPPQPFVDPIAPRIVSMASPFGLLTTLAPVAEFSDTPSYFARPPEPSGAAMLEWLPR